MFSNVIEYNSNTIRNAGYAVPIWAALSFGGCKDNPVAPVTPVAPDAPSSLTGTPLTETSGRLTWQDNSDNETNFYIWRASNGQFVKYDSVGANVTQYTDSRIPRGGTEQYEVSAIDKATSLESGKSNAVTICPDVIPPGKPALTLAAKSWGEIDANWTPSDKETYYDLYRGTNTSNMQKVATFQSGATSYADTGVVPLTKYFYKIIAGDALSQSTSNIDSATTKEAIINISGKLLDAYTRGIIPNTPITVTYRNNNVTFTPATDGNGNYSVDVHLGSGLSHDIDINLLSSTLYNYLEHMQLRSKQDIKNYAKDIYDFERFKETGLLASTATGMDSLRDGLTFLKYMQYIGEVSPVNNQIIKMTRRWRDQDMPIGYFFENLPSVDSTYTENSLNDYNNTLSFQPFRKASSSITNGLVCQYSPNSGTTISNLQYFIDNNGNYLYPKDVWALQVSQGDEGIDEHELWHLLTTTLRHSPFLNHRSFGKPFGSDNMSTGFVISDFEKKILEDLYGLPNNTDMSCYYK